MENIKNSELFDILLRNNQEELQDFLLSKGKGPKPICPIIFINKGESDYDKN